ncbi:hypothetical protein ONZ43_g4807 [Nemania bipapillata]|uniref:Uncharacterized protein n=1 Tax=Nemania bipapillata TaxID=110536 RepID=A0ACC2II17_9PEZI|nr:hypothetical protein ONZ43_g4807 [Nemania bipapillata]
MSGFPVDGSSDPTSDVLPVGAISENLDESVGQSTIQKAAKRAQLASLPNELLLEVLKWLDKRDWLTLARTCRRLANFSAPELDRYTLRRGDDYGYALWYACAVGKPDVLLRQIFLDSAVIHGHFQHNFTHKTLTRAIGKNMTPLAVAIASGNHTIARLLLAHGADPDGPDSRPVLCNLVLYHPIHWAVTSPLESSIPIIQALRACSVDMNQLPTDTTHGTSAEAKSMLFAPIFRALTLEKPLSCRIYVAASSLALLACGADPDVRYSGDGETPIFFLLGNLAHYTPSFYFSDRLILSHEAKAQADLINDIVASFLDTLHRFGANLNLLSNIHCFWWFLNQGPMINSQDIEGRTALHELCDNEHLGPQVKEKTVAMLLKRGADPTLLDVEGHAPGYTISALRILEGIPEKTMTGVSMEVAKLKALLAIELTKQAQTEDIEIEPPGTETWMVE